MKLNEYMTHEKMNFVNLTDLIGHLSPTLDYIVQKLDSDELGDLCVELCSLSTLWKISKDDDVSRNVQVLTTALATCLLVDHLQSHRELIYELLNAPSPVIPDKEET